MSIKALARESNLQNSLRALSDASGVLLSALDDQVLSYEEAQVAELLVQHQFATRRPGKQQYVITPHLRRFLKSIVQVQQLQHADLPPVAENINDLANQYADYIAACREGRQRDRERALEDFTDICQQIFSEMEHCLRRISSDYDACRDDAGISHANKMRRNKQLVGLVQQLLQRVTLLRAGTSTPEDELALHPELPDLTSLRRINDGYGFARAYTHYIGSMVDHWIARVQVLSAEINRYFITLKLASQQYLRAEAVSKYLKASEGVARVHQFHDQLHEAPSQDDAITPRIHIGWWSPLLEDVHAPLLAAHADKIERPAAIPRVANVRPVRFIEQVDDEKPAPTPYEYLALQLLVQAGKATAPVAVWPAVKALAEKRTRETGEHVNHNVAFFSVYAVLDSHIAIGSRFARGVASMTVVGEYDAGCGHILVEDLQLIPRIIKAA